VHAVTSTSDALFSHDILDTLSYFFSAILPSMYSEFGDWGLKISKVIFDRNGEKEMLLIHDLNKKKKKKTTPPVEIKK
jgi:hypothetical protein